MCLFFTFILILNNNARLAQMQNNNNFNPHLIITINFSSPISHVMKVQKKPILHISPLKRSTPWNLLSLQKKYIQCDLHKPSEEMKHRFRRRKKVLKNICQIRKLVMKQRTMRKNSKESCLETKSRGGSKGHVKETKI